MKNKITLIGLFLTGLSTVSGASAKSLKDTSGMSVIRNFAHSFVHANAEELKSILDDAAVMKIPRFKQVIIQTKDQLVEAEQLDSGTLQDCSNEIAVLSSSDAIIMAEVKFKYSNFQEHVYLTVERRDDQWKITQIIKMFSDEIPVTQPMGNITAK